MNNDGHNLIAFCVVTIAIVIMFGLSVYCLSHGKNIETIGLGTIMGGMVGVLGTFRPRTVSDSNVSKADTVNIENK